MGQAPSGPGRSQERQAPPSRARPRPRTQAPPTSAQAPPMSAQAPGICVFAGDHNHVAASHPVWVQAPCVAGTRRGRLWASSTWVQIPIAAH